MQENSPDEFSFKGVAPDDRLPAEHGSAPGAPLEGQLESQLESQLEGDAASPAVAPASFGMEIGAICPPEEPSAPLPSAPVPPASLSPEAANAMDTPPTTPGPESIGGEPSAPLPNADATVQGAVPAEMLSGAVEGAPEVIDPASLIDPCQVNPATQVKKARVTVEIEGEDPRGAAAVSPRHMVQGWLAQMVEAQASDLILRSGGRPSQRLDGKISFLPGEVPGPGPMLEVLRGILGDRRMEAFEEQGAADAALDLDGLGRFRINAYKQMGEPAIVIRRINEDAPSLDDLNLPAQDLKDLALRKRGLVLVTGVAGSGKSTTLSAMIEFMNRNVERHVVTLEDPVELIFKERYCVISQREVGTDTTSFKQGLKHALRQSPDVIFIGEMRDAETVLAALEAIETGHLVMSTMHTVNAAQTVDRILGFFPAERHVQIRQRMADTLAGVLSMRLVPRKGGGQVPAYELMQCTPQVRELLEEGKTTELGRVIEGGMEPGLVAFNDRLLDLVQTGMVEMDDAIQTSDRPDELIMMMRGIQGGTRAKAKANASPNGQGEAPGEAPHRRRSDPQAGGDQQPGHGSDQHGAQPPGGQQHQSPGQGSLGGGGSNLRLKGTGPGESGAY